MRLAGKRSPHTFDYKSDGGWRQPSGTDFENRTFRSDECSPKLTGEITIKAGKSPLRSEKSSSPVHNRRCKNTAVGGAGQAITTIGCILLRLRRTNLNNPSKSRKNCSAEMFDRCFRVTLGRRNGTTAVRRAFRTLFIILDLPKKPRKAQRWCNCCGALCKMWKECLVPHLQRKGTDAW